MKGSPLEAQEWCEYAAATIQEPGEQQDGQRYGHDIRRGVLLPTRLRDQHRPIIEGENGPSLRYIRRYE